MQIRTATEQDTPAIVDLLKLSLGESLVPKSIGYWTWKHLQNPFGASPVLTSWDNETLIGVRAFMRWEWTSADSRYKALRAVDTATHPDYQGKGIFKKLTLALIDDCKKNGDDFIFNTPNTQSRPGYIKMGWQIAGKMPIVIGIGRPVRVLKNIVFSDKTHGDTSTKDERNLLQYYLAHPQLPELLQHRKNYTSVTNFSIPYLQWRYLDVPVANYVGIGDEESGTLTGLVIGRIKQSKFGRELRITDCFLKQGQFSERLLRSIAAFKKNAAIDYCSISGLGNPAQSRLMGSLRWKGTIGPIVTVRSLCMSDLTILQNFNRWSPSIGDLELF